MLRNNLFIYFLYINYNFFIKIKIYAFIYNIKLHLLMSHTMLLYLSFNNYSIIISGLYFYYCYKSNNILNLVLSFVYCYINKTFYVKQKIPSNVLVSFNVNGIFISCFIISQEICENFPVGNFFFV